MQNKATLANQNQIYSACSRRTSTSALVIGAVAGLMGLLSVAISLWGTVAAVIYLLDSQTINLHSLQHLGVFVLGSLLAAWVSHSLNTASIALNMNM